MLVWGCIAPYLAIRAEGVKWKESCFCEEREVCTPWVCHTKLVTIWFIAKGESLLAEYLYYRRLE